MKYLFSLLLLAIFAIPAMGQSISIFDIDTTNFPTMKAKFYAFDKDGKQQRPSASELTITENGINQTITNVSCPPLEPPKTVSVAMSIDLSGSMASSDFGELPVELGKLTATELCKAIAMPPSSFALQTCNDKTLLIQDFTTNRNKIINSLPNIFAGGDNDFNMHLLDKISGLLNIAKTGKNKKVAVLYTDAWWFALSSNELKSCLDTCKKYNIEFYTVIYSRKEAEPNGIKMSLKEICLQTGGYFYEGITTKEAAKNIASNIQSLAQDIIPCEIKWLGYSTCISSKRDLNLSLNGNIASAYYDSPSSIDAELKVNPISISFGKLLPSSQKDLKVIFSAYNSDYTIYKINNKFGSSDFTVINVTFPLIIPNNSSKEITLRFAPIDSSFAYTSFEIETDKCPAYFSANGGFPLKNTKTPTLKLKTPNGSEFYVVGSDTLIQWEGVSPEDTVNLEYSIDSGTNWNSITKLASKLQFKWNNIPLPESNKCLVRVSQDSPDKENYLNLLGHTDYVTSVSFSPDGTKVATSSKDNSGKIWDPISGSIIFTLQGHNDFINSIVFSPDGTKIATASEDRTIKIWNSTTGAAIRTISIFPSGILAITYSPDGRQIAIAGYDETSKIIDANTGVLVNNLIGHLSWVKSIVYSPDGKIIATASEDNTIKLWDALTGTNLRTLLGHKSAVNDIAFNLDGSKIASVSMDKTSIIWDVSNGALLKTLTGHIDRVVSVSFNPDGTQVVTTSYDKNIKIWDINSGNEIRNIVGHSGVVSGVSYNPDGKRLVTSSWDKSAKIWEVYGAVVQQDISDSVFSIIAPSPLSQNVDMKQCIIGASKDSLISTFMINNGTYQYRVDSIAITGANASQFRLVSGTPPFVVPANANRAVEFNFKPTSVGIKTAQLTIYTQADTLFQTIQGEGIAPQLEIVNNFIDFGLVDVGSFKDTIQVVTIKNVGSAALNINNSLHLGPNDIDFTTLSGAAPFSLNAGETAKMNLRFSPKSIGRTSGRLQFEFNGAGSPATVQLFGTGLGGTATINIGSDSAFTEEEVEITVNILANNKLLNSGVTTISFELEMNKTILFPIGVNSTIDGENRIIKFDSVPIKNVGVNEVAKLKFIATLGNAEETAISVRNILTHGNDAEVDPTDGNFKLLGVCKEGGERFLSSSINQTKLLSIAPNPATESIEIEYSNADEGEAEIIISNLLGQTILTQKLEKTQTGKTKLDLSQIPTGQYSILFKTETMLENRVIQVIK